MELEKTQELISEAFKQGQNPVLTCSFQAEDVALLALLREQSPAVPVLFLDTGYHFPEVYAYRDQIAALWGINLINVLPAETVAEQEAHLGLLYQSDPGACCRRRKTEPLFGALAAYDLWFTGMRREQAKTRAHLEPLAQASLPSGQPIVKANPLFDWTSSEVFAFLAVREIPVLSLYDQGYTSVGCAPCTSLPSVPGDPRSGRWGGQKTECGIHVHPGGGVEAS